jgi:Phage tail tube protein
VTQQVIGQEAIGVAFETTVGTAVTPPLKWIPLRSESLQQVEDKPYRQNLRASVDRVLSNQGPYHIEGDIEFEVTADTLVYILYLSRMLPSRTGAGPYTYTFAPSSAGRPTTAASGVTVARTGTFLIGRSSANAFIYSGCSVSQLAFSFDNLTLICTASIIGTTVATGSLSAQTWPTTLPYGVAQNTVELPSATPRADVASWNITINDNGAAEDRLDGTRSAAFTRWGEREVSFSGEIDFDALTDYNAFIAATSQSMIVKSSRVSASDEVKFTLNNTVFDTFSIGGSGGQGDLVMASVDGHATLGSTDPYSISIGTTEVIT